MLREKFRTLVVEYFSSVEWKTQNFSLSNGSPLMMVPWISIRSSLMA